MRYSEFRIAFESFPVFSTQDIRKRFSDYDGRRLVEWQAKGYLTKIKRGYYSLSQNPQTESEIHFIANKIYSPSYVSIESALVHYGFIPEAAFTVTSVSTKNTSTQRTPLGNFEYRHTKPSMYFGYKLLKFQNYSVRMAEPEKAILDFFYLSTINDRSSIEEIRFNKIQLNELLDMKRLTNYQQLIGSRILDRRIRLFLKVIHA